MCATLSPTKPVHSPAQGARRSRPGGRATAASCASWRVAHRPPAQRQQRNEGCRACVLCAAVPRCCCSPHTAGLPRCCVCAGPVRPGAAPAAAQQGGLLPPLHGTSLPAARSLPSSPFLAPHPQSRLRRIRMRLARPPTHAHPGVHPPPGAPQPEPQLRHPRPRADAPGCAHGACTHYPCVRCLCGPSRLSNPLRNVRFGEAACVRPCCREHCVRHLPGHGLDRKGVRAQGATADTDARIRSAHALRLRRC